MKGLRDDNVCPLGQIDVDENCSYFYYHVVSDHSILELEAIYEPTEQRYSRKVTCVVSREVEVDELIDY